MALTAVYAGDEDEGREVLGPMLGVAEPLLNGIGPLPPAALCRIHGDPEQPIPGMADVPCLDALEEGPPGADRDRGGGLEQSVAGGRAAPPRRSAGPRRPRTPARSRRSHGAYTVGSSGWRWT